LLASSSSAFETRSGTAGVTPILRQYLCTVGWVVACPRADARPAEHRSGSERRQQRGELPAIRLASVVVQRMRLEPVLGDAARSADVDRRDDLAGVVDLDARRDGVGPARVEEVRERNDLVVDEAPL